MSGAARVTAHDIPTLSIYHDFPSTLDQFQRIEVATRLSGQFAHIHALTSTEWMSLSAAEQDELASRTCRLRNGIRLVVTLCDGAP